MQVLAKGKYIGVSPKKARAVADLVRGQNAQQSRVMLAAMPQAGARAIVKVIDSAMANAENNFNLEKSELTISKIVVNNGPVAKRYQPRAKGMASTIKRRTSHIEVVVSGEIKTKKVASKVAEPKTAKESTEQKSQKIEVERPAVKSFSAAPKNAGTKMFRRKSGM